MGNLYYSLAIQQIARGYFTSTSYYITSLKTKTKQNATKAHILLLLLYNVCMYIYIQIISPKNIANMFILLYSMKCLLTRPGRGSAATSPKKGSVQFPRDQGPAEWDALELVECW